jgi:hypothetical protein
VAFDRREIHVVTLLQKVAKSARLLAPLLGSKLSNNSKFQQCPFNYMIRDQCSKATVRSRLAPPSVMFLGFLRTRERRVSIRIIEADYHTSHITAQSDITGSQALSQEQYRTQTLKLRILTLWQQYLEPCGGTYFLKLNSVIVWPGK